MKIEGKRVKILLWDIAGQERFRPITYSYCRDVDGFVLVYDVTDENSFFNISQWINVINELNGSLSKIIVGNKCEMVSDRCVSTANGIALAKKYGALFYETSAKNDINVEKAFVDIAKEIIKTKDLDERNGQNSACQIL